MPDFKQFKMPDVGEGLTEADILRWVVKPGDTVAVNEIIVEVETAKAAVELPSQANPNIRPWSPAPCLSSGSATPSTRTS
jgi:hypothetical protein